MPLGAAVSDNSGRSFQSGAAVGGGQGRGAGIVFRVCCGATSNNQQVKCNRIRVCV